MLYHIVLKIPRVSSNMRRIAPAQRSFVVEAATGSDAMQMLIQERPSLFKAEGITHTVVPWGGAIVALT